MSMQGSAQPEKRENGQPREVTWQATRFPRTAARLDAQPRCQRVTEKEARQVQEWAGDCMTECYNR